MTNNQRLVYIALLAAQAVIISLIERAIPSPFAIAPGAKLGLANIITCMALYTLPVKDASKVVMIRIILLRSWVVRFPPLCIVPLELL